MRTFLIALLAVSSAAVAHAQSVRLPREGPRPTNVVQPVYADSDRAAGVQGEVIVGGVIQPDGSIADVAVIRSSRSAVLDEASVAALRQWTFVPAAEAVPYQVEVSFSRDDLETLATKTCSELNVDVAYFRQTFPESPISDMPLKHVLVGIMMVQRGMSLENIRSSSAAYDRTVDWCSTRTNELMFERYLRFAR